MGPTSYNPSYKMVRIKSSTAAAKFAKSMVQRSLLNQQANTIIPGPGDYEFDPNVTNKQNFNCIFYRIYLQIS